MALSPAMFSGEDVTFIAGTCDPVIDAAAAGECELYGYCHGTYPGTMLPHNQLPEIALIGYWNAVRSQKWGLPMHRNEGIELTYLECGSLDFTVDGHPYKLEPGDLTITRPWQPHQVGAPNIRASRLHFLILDVAVRRPHTPWVWPPWLLLSKADMDELTSYLRQNETHVWKNAQTVGKSFLAVAELFNRSPLKDGLVPETRLKFHINELLIHLHEMFKSARPERNANLSSTSRTVEMFINELPQHIAAAWTLDSMASCCGLARSRFAHYFKQLTNRSPLAFLTECRLQAACEQLERFPDKSICDIAFDCGFSSSQYFSTIFRKKMGMSPVHYRVEGFEMYQR